VPRAVNVLPRDLTPARGDDSLASATVIMGPQGDGWSRSNSPESAEAVADRHDDVTLSLWWAARRTVGLMVVVPVIGILIGLFVPMNAPDVHYRASALVVATELNSIRPEHLPRMVQAISSGNSVPTRALERTTLPMTPAEFREQVEVETIAETVVIRVSGLADYPKPAAEIANAAAAALVGELNRMGPEVGTFAIHEVAVPPRELDMRSPIIPSWLLGGIVGLVLAVGLLVLLVAVKRPVLTHEQARDLSGLPILGVLRLWHASVRQGPDEAEGVVDLALCLYPHRNECTVFLTPGHRRSRTQASLLVARTLALIAPVVYRPARDRFGRRAARLAQAHGIVCTGVPERVVSADTAVVIDGPWSDDVRLHRPASLVLVVAEGVPRGALARYLETRSRPVDGIVWVVELGLLRSWLHRLRADRSEGRTDLSWPSQVPSCETVMDSSNGRPRVHHEDARSSRASVRS